MLHDCYKVFRAQVDTNDSHRDDTGHLPVVYKQHISVLLQQEKIGDDDYAKLKPEDKEILQEEATRLTKEAYLACFFLVIADNKRYGGSRWPCTTTTCWTKRVAPVMC